MIGSALHPSGYFPSWRHGDSEIHRAFFPSHQIHPTGGATDERMSLVVLSLIVTQRIAENLVGNRDCIRTRKIDAPGLAVRLAPNQFFAVRAKGVKGLDIRGIVLQVIRARSAIGD